MRTTPPGQHGPKKLKKKKISPYGIQNREKQKIRFSYGLKEKQLKNLFLKLQGKKGNTAQLILTYLYHFLVNQAKINKPGYLVEPQDIITLTKAMHDNKLIKQQLEQKVKTADFLKLDKEKLEITYLRHPSMEELEKEIEGIDFASDLKSQVVTVLKSPHKHKRAQEHLGRITHRRLIQVVNASFVDLNKAGLTGSYPQISRGVQVRIKQSPSQKKVNKNQIISTNEKQDIYPYNEKSLVTSKHNYERADNYNPSAELKFEENGKKLSELFLGVFWFWQKKLAGQQAKLKQTQIKQQKKEINFTTHEEKNRLTQITLANQTKNLQQEEKRVNDLKISQMEEKEAQETLFLRLKEKIKDNLDKQAQKEIKRSQAKIEEETTKIICLALEKYSSELVYGRTVSHLKIEDSRIMGRIIGRDGRNINLFRKITGTEVLIPEKIATRTLQRLINEQKISPLQIENIFQETSQEIEEIILQSGVEVLAELQIGSIHPELIKCLGKLKFRTSYGQNVLEHSLEVAKLAGSIAAELGLDINLARRAGLLHDIGKAIEDDGLSHVTSGIALAKQYKESAVVINAIASHHRNFPADNPYSLIVSAADTLSAARPGARGQQLEAYIARMENLEKLAHELPEVEKIYAFQAGREIWVIVNAQKVNDYQLLEISEILQNKIRERVIIPGEIIISVLRETKLIKKMNTFSQISSPKKKQNK
ncbi:15975_t:CDS:2 [Funneliformis geosporum]|uniref:15975_t:CDS:1 n=1 Tax=Funneliformis geosporum TaxID=1117311 RepID=A0A9W4SUQ2_9GLOM|nr:15975_t:CDS:2 [Funneliformis geosporum]